MKKNIPSLALTLILIIFIFPNIGVQTFHHNGINYYPSKHGWERMWCFWDPHEIEYELDIARRIGVNSIRTFIQFSVVQNYTSMCPSLDTPTALDRLDQFLGIASSRGMKTIVGLFDEARLLLDLVTVHPHLATLHLNTVLNYKNRDGIRFGDDPRISMWDLVNELDGSDKKTKEGRALFIRGDDVNQDGIKWLHELYQIVLDHTLEFQRVTFGVLNPNTSVYLFENGFNSRRNQPQYHEYTTYTLPDYMERMEQHILWIAEKTKQTVLIGETGAPSACCSTPTVCYNMTIQNYCIESILGIAKKHQTIVEGVSLWTLMDWNYDHIPDTNIQKHYGLYFGDYKPKLAAQTVKSFFLDPL